jgi:hypothetical protein
MSEVIKMYGVCTHKTSIYKTKSEIVTSLLQTFSIRILIIVHIVIIMAFIIIQIIPVGIEGGATQIPVMTVGKK